MASLNNSFDIQQAKIKQVETFLNRVGAKATIRYREEPRYTPPTWGPTPNDVRDFYTSFEKEYIPIVTMELPESSLTHIIERLSDLEDMQRRYGPNIEIAVRDAIANSDAAWRESRVREENPGVKKAWEKYQMMLKIAGG